MIMARLVMACHCAIGSSAGAREVEKSIWLLGSMASHIPASFRNLPYFWKVPGQRVPDRIPDASELSAAGALLQDDHVRDENRRRKKCQARPAADTQLRKNASPAGLFLHPALGCSNDP